MNYMNFIGHQLDEAQRILGEFQLFLKGIPYSIRSENDDFIHPSHFKIQLRETIEINGYDLDVITVKKSNESIFEDGRWFPSSININVLNYYNPFGNPDQVVETESNFHFSYVKGYEWFAEKIMEHFGYKSLYDKIEKMNEDEKKKLRRQLEDILRKYVTTSQLAEICKVLFHPLYNSEKYI